LRPIIKIPQIFERKCIKHVAEHKKEQEDEDEEWVEEGEEEQMWNFFISVATYYTAIIHSI